MAELTRILTIKEDLLIVSLYVYYILLIMFKMAWHLISASVIPPSFTERLYDISIKEGEPVRLTVRVAGHPPPEVTWYREGQQLVSSPDFEIIQVRMNRCSCHFHGKVDNLMYFNSLCT